MRTHSAFPTRGVFACAEYGKVLAMLGDRRFKAHCMDGKERICHIPGRFNKRMWIAVVSGAASHILGGWCAFVDCSIDSSSFAVTRRSQTCICC